MKNSLTPTAREIIRTAAQLLDEEAQSLREASTKPPDHVEWDAGADLEWYTDTMQTVSHLNRMITEESPPKDGYFWQNFSISEEVAKYASRYPVLEPIATGGGCDYVARSLPAVLQPTMVLGCADDPGSSPESLSEPAAVYVYFDGSWQTWIRLPEFPTVEGAIDWMGGYPHPSFGTA